MSLSRALERTVQTRVEGCAIAGEGLESRMLVEVGCAAHIIGSFLGLVYAFMWALSTCCWIAVIMLEFSIFMRLEEMRMEGRPERR